MLTVFWSFVIFLEKASDYYVEGSMNHDFGWYCVGLRSFAHQPEENNSRPSFSSNVSGLPY